MGQRFGGIVEQIAARVDRGNVLGPGLRVHRHHKVDAAAPTKMTGAADPDLIPGGQALDVRRKDVSRRDRYAHPQDRLREHGVGAGRAGTIHVGELDYKVVHRRQWRGAATGIGFIHHVRHASPACVMLRRNLRISQAPVGQRSAQRPQCRQTSSSFTITLPVGNRDET